MKKHFEYIGYGRSGSTYLYSLLKNHSYFVDSFKILRKENTLLIDGNTFSEYKKVYDPYCYSINMCTTTRLLNSSQLKELNDYTDKFFMLIRNPHDYISSLIKYTRDENVINEFSLNNSFNYVRMIERIKQNINKPLKIIIFDDLITNTEFVLKKLLDFLELPYESLIKGDEFINSSNSFVYSSNTKSAIATDSALILNNPLSIHQKDIINQNIDNLSCYLNRDFSLWKR